jgi:hypothetical protein
MALTFGQRIRRDLNLLPNLDAAIVKVYGFPIPIFVVCYNSRIPERLPVKRKIHRAVGVFLFSRTGHSKLMFSNPYPLDHYNSSLTKYLLITLDLAGEWTRRPVVKDLESISFKEITINDLRKSHTVSPLTQRYATQRKTLQGPENRLAKLIQVELDRKKDRVIFKFLTDATMNAHKPGYKPMELVPGSDGVLQPNPSKLYELWVQVDKFFSLLGTRPDPEAKITVMELKEVFVVADVKLFSTMPSFHWQGMAANLTQIDAAIFPVDILPTIWRDRMGGDFFLSKDFANLLKHFDFFLPQMARLLSRELKKVNT